MFKKCLILVILLIVSVSTVTSSLAVTISIDNGDRFYSDLWAKGQTMNSHIFVDDQFIAPISLELNSVQYIAFCVDFFSPLWAGNWSYTISDASDYINNNYVDPENSLEYAIFNLENNWESSIQDNESRAYTQLNLWDTLYDYQPSSNMHIDSNFMYFDIHDNYGNNYTNQFNHGGPYQNGLLNATSNGSYSVDAFIDLYSVITVSQEGSNEIYQTLLIKTGSSPIPEPATLLLFGFGLICVSKYSRKK